MSGSVQLNGVRVTKASITQPLYGLWTADVELEGTTEVTPAVTLTVGGLSLVGTVYRQNAFAGARKVRIVGGGGGWRKTLPARGYSLPGGVTLSAVLGDAARESGERVSVGQDRQLGPFYTRDQGRAKRVLRLLATNWYVDNAGVTQVRTRPTSPIATPFTVSKWDGATNTFEIATETYEDWAPGRTFMSNTVPAPMTISSVTIDADNEGRVRLTVQTSATLRERMLADFRAIVQDELAAVSYAGVYEYVIAAGASAAGLSYTIDATPTDPRMPPLTRVPLAPDLGRVSPSATGTKCRIRFVNADPSRPEVIAIAGQTEHALTVEAFAVIMHNALFGLGAAGLPAAWLASGIIPGIINAALAASTSPAPLIGAIAQTAAGATQAAAMVSGPGFSSSPYKAAIAAGFAAKSPDVTGLFPGLGVDNG